MPIWLASEVIGAAVQLGSRGIVVLLLLSAGVLYHRLVKRVTFRQFAFAGALLLSAFLVAGVLRGLRSGAPSVERPRNVLTAANEFQGLFTTAFDLHKRKEA